MKKLLFVTLMFGSIATGFSQTYVDGHVRSDGTYVNGHYRSNPDGNYNNNWSTQGNYNPYTGQQGTRNPQQGSGYGSGGNGGGYNSNFDSIYRR